jgi:Isoleucyl-tRNA synthetase (EC 6.1.1.5)
LSLKEIEITSKDVEGWLVANQGAMTVALDVQLSDDLIKEGVARELVNRIQNLRKDSGLEVTDRISITIEDHPVVSKAIDANSRYIKEETLADDLTVEKVVEDGTIIEFDDVLTRMTIQKMN